MWGTAAQKWSAVRAELFSSARRVSTLNPRVVVYLVVTVLG